MDIEAEYEIKFHIYDGNEKQLEKYKSEYSSISKSNKEEGTVMSKVQSYFFEGLVELISGDIEFWNQNYREAFKFYKESITMFNRFSNSRNVRARLDLLAERMLNRAEGLKLISEAKSLSDRKLIFELYTEALKKFNKEVSLANTMGETMSSYASFYRASFAESQLLLTKAKMIEDEDSGEAKKSLMNARQAIRQAAFIDPRLLTVVNQVEDELDNLTKSRILIKAENYGDEATKVSEDGNFLEAKSLFKKASMFYKRASTLASDTSSRRYLLSSATIYEASELEAEGNQLFRIENNTAEATEKFEKAAKQVEKAIALMGRFGSETLEENFTCQRDYYRAMGIQTNAINLFDEEEYLEAKEKFEESLNLFDDSIKEAIRGENAEIENLSKEAKADINGYLSMCEAMI